MNDKGYPPQQGYPPDQGYPPPQQQLSPSQQGYQLQQYPPPQQGYPPQQYPRPHQGFPPQQGYPHQPGASPQQVPVTQVVMRDPQNRADDHLVFAILVTIFCCWPCGIVAIIKSLDVRNLNDRGDYTSAQQASQEARKWSIITLVCGIVIELSSVVIIILYFAVFAVTATTVSYNTYDRIDNTLDDIDDTDIFDNNLFPSDSVFG